jgi:acyl-CoA thioester hydrolase
MPRVKLKPLDRYSFRTEIVIRVTDLNYGGHLGNDRLLSLLHEARVAFLAEHGLSEPDCGGVSLTMGDAVLVYRGEAFAGDQLRFEVAAGEPSRFGFRLFYRVTRLPAGEEIALAETGMVCYDYEEKKLCRLPEAVKRNFMGPGPGVRSN